MFKRKGLFLGIMVVVCGLLLTGCGKKNDVDVDVNNGGNDKPNTTVSTDYLSISTTDLVVPVGSTATFDISLKNAVGRFDVTVADTNIATVDEDKVWIESVDETTDVKTITVTGNQAGTTQIVVSLADVATYDTEEELTGTYKINVTVK